MTEVVELKNNTNNINNSLQINNSNGSVKKSNKKINKRHKKKKNKNTETDSKKEQEEEVEIREENRLSPDTEIEYISELPIDSDNPLFSQFSDVFSKFTINNDDEEETNQDSNYEMNISNKNKDDEDDEYNSEEENTSLSKKKLKKLGRLSIAELKQLTKRPEVVEWVDATASDPGLLLTLKSHRNAVPVPAHWSQKRKYLQGKRGIEKPPFELPDFIKDTGIMEMRAAAKDKEDSSKLKTKARERMQPKMGKLDIDYQRLHDAFFRFQTKPRLTRHGELYFEGKEFEAKLKEKKPGQLSEELKAALNIPPLAPPPWLINMQRFGPPPSYPNLKIPGLNCPIPHGANWGYHPGGWGKPPVDENNRPLYGDVFGINQFDYNDNNAADVNKDLWGQIVSEEEYEEAEEEEAEEEQEEQAEEASAGGEEGDLHQPAPPTQENIAEGYATPSGFSSVQTGLQTPEFVELRKGRKLEEEPKQLFHILPEQQSSITGMVGSQHVYNMDVLGESSANEPRKRRRFDVDVSLDPSELENPEAVAAKYQQAQTQQTGGSTEDLSDLVAENNLKRNKKRSEKPSKASEKRRDFKF